MKYKYLKGSEKDFEGAPEWALVAIKCDGFNAVDFAASLTVGERCYYADCRRERLINFIDVWTIIAERRPITEPSWDGVGLPPVGCKIEYSYNHQEIGRPAIEAGAWYEGIIIAYYDDCVWTSDNGIRCLGNTKFRPLRSEADKKRNAAVMAINNTVDASGTLGSEIYDAIAAGKTPGVKL